MRSFNGSEVKVAAFCIFLVTLLILCVATLSPAVKNKFVEETQFCETNVDHIYYDADTKIAYILMYFDTTIVLSPYISANGLPYQYIDGRLVEIDR